MPTFADRLATGLSRIRGHAGESVTYRRGASQATIAQAVVGDTREQTVDNTGMLLTIKHTDFIVAQSSLVLGGVTTEPKLGDTIERSDGTIWEVAPTMDERGFRDVDHHGHAWRIHTKRIK